MWDGYRVRDWTNPAPKPPEASYTFIDVFASIGGFRFGFEPKGGHCVWSCEIDSWARRTYSVNHGTPEGEIFRDVREAGPKDVPDHDVLVAGFPCQSFSGAGRTKLNSLGRPTGFADEARGILFFEIVRLLVEHPPRFFLLENVPGLLTYDQGRTMATVLWMLTDELGYRVDHRVLDSRAYVPQTRRRVFIAGRRGREKPDLAGFADKDTQGPTLGDILHPQDGTETAEEPYTRGAMAEVPEKYTLGPGTWATLCATRRTTDGAATARDMGRYGWKSLYRVDTPSKSGPGPPFFIHAGDRVSVGVLCPTNCILVIP